MHELGIVFYIIRDVKQVAEENHVSHVSRVVMHIGEVSTVIPEYLTDCWRWAADKETCCAAVSCKSCLSRPSATAATASKNSKPCATAKPALSAKAATPGSCAATKSRSKKSK